MNVDYSKWDSLAAEVDADEAAEKNRQRELNKQRYFKDQEEKQRKWKEQQEREQKNKPKEETKEEHHHDEHCGHDHDQHSHDHSNHAHPPSSAPSPSPSPPSSSSSVPPVRGCGCGYLSPEQLDALKQQYESNPSAFDTSSATHQQQRQEVNHKKLVAIRSVREHGKELIQSNQYDVAIQIYERGLTIIAGAYDMDASHQDEMNEFEGIFNLNIAICKFHLKSFRDCQSYCKSCLQMSPGNIKALYRYACAAVEMGEYEEGVEYLQKILQSDVGKGNKEAISMMKEIDRRKAEEKKKAKDFYKKMGEKLNKLGVESAVTDGPSNGSESCQQEEKSASSD